jgi:hypothetical protein
VLFPSLPISSRLAILVLLLALAALADWCVHRSAATRWKEYSFLLAAAFFGALFGLVNDALTSWLSPAYFIYAKGIAAGPHFRQQALTLGFQAGFGAAFIAAACYLFANNPKPGLPSLPYRQLSAFILRPLLAALILALVLGITSRWFIPPTVDSPLASVIGPAAAVWFWRVWCIHFGLYLGLLLGTISACFAIRRARRTLAKHPPQP